MGSSGPRPVPPARSPGWRPVLRALLAPRSGLAAPALLGPTNSSRALPRARESPGTEPLLVSNFYLLSALLLTVRPIRSPVVKVPLRRASTALRVYQGARVLRADVPLRNGREIVQERIPSGACPRRGGPTLRRLDGRRRRAARRCLE